jgi:hypothetical protein
MRSGNPDRNANNRCAGTLAGWLSSGPIGPIQRPDRVDRGEPAHQNCFSSPAIRVADEPPPTDRGTTLYGAMPSVQIKGVPSPSMPCCASGRRRLISRCKNSC